MRQVILDTETTGLRIEEGHRIIEVGCLEMVNRKLTGKYFHYYLNPEREIDSAAIAIHGISNEFLKDKPFFKDIDESFIDFISDSELIIHNAPFDLSFLNDELIRTGRGWKKLSNYCRVIDTLVMARQMHVGQRNNLDALCKRYGIDNTKRDWHGALLDASLLAQVYLAMTGGQGSFFDAININQTEIAKQTYIKNVNITGKYEILIIKADDDELNAHTKYLELLEKQGKCIWQELT